MGFLCYAGSFRPSPKPDADNRRTPNAAVAPIRSLAAVHIEDKRSHPASDRQPNTLGRPLRWRISPGIRATSSETADEARAHTTVWGLLKQPYKQKSSSPPKFRNCNTRCGYEPPDFRRGFGVEAGEAVRHAGGVSGN